MIGSAKYTSLVFFGWKCGKNMMLCFSNLITDRSESGLARHFSGSTCSSMAAGEPRLNNANTQRGEETHVKIYKCHQSIGDICMLQG